MADNFASYFPVTVTGGTTNPMVGADVVQGPNPQALGLDPILAAIQSQYTPQTFTHSGGSYGAQRFIDGSSSVSGFTPPVIGGGNIAQPWFTPGAFNLADYQTDLPSDLAEQVATGSVYGGDSYSPVSNVGNESWMSDPYAGLAPMSGLKSGINALIPGAGLLIGAAQGYSGATSANTLNDVLNYLGDEGLGKVDPLKATALGAFGITPQSLKDAQDFYKIFDQNSATMLNWAAQPKDTASNQIVDFLTDNAQNPLSPQDIGVMSWAVRADIDKAVASGRTLSDAVINVAISKGIDPSQAAQMGVNASKSAVEQGLKQGLSLDDMDPSAVAVYNNPSAALIDSTRASENAAVRMAAEQNVNNSVRTVEQALSQGVSLQDMNPSDVAAYNDPLGALIDSINARSPVGGIDDKGLSIAASDAAFLKAIGAPLTPVAPVQVPATTPTSDSSSAPTEAPTGGYVTDSRGNIVTSGDGTAVTWGTGAPSYTPTENEQSFASTDGYTADVPSASQGGYDPTSGYDTDTDSGGGGGGSSKIVCTAMNQSYGFGSYRNAIWLKYSADRMTKAHEAGYHAIFLPLIDLAYKRNNKPVRIALEHIARHRTADLRAEMRGSKRDTLGRAYRFVLEPLCYVVGKIKGYR